MSTSQTDTFRNYKVCHAATCVKHAHKFMKKIWKSGNLSKDPLLQNPHSSQDILVNASHIPFRSSLWWHISALLLSHFSITSNITWPTILGKVSSLFYQSSMLVGFWDISPTCCFVIGVDSVCILHLLSTLTNFMSMTLQNISLQCSF